MINERQAEKIKYKLLNLFAEFICREIGMNESTKVEIVDFENFWVVKGFTTSKEILDLNKIKEKFQTEFSENFDDLKLSNTIDLITYDSELEKSENINLDFFNTKSLTFESCLDSNLTPLSLKSQFPFGYSKDMGKTMYYYAKHLAYNLQTKYNWDKISMSLSKEKNEDRFEIYLDVCDQSNENIKSSILDSFDFNYASFDKKLQDCEWWRTITEENYEYDFVKKLNEDFVIF